MIVYNKKKKALLCCWRTSDPDAVWDAVAALDPEYKITQTY